MYAEYHYPGPVVKSGGRYVPAKGNGLKEYVDLTLGELQLKWKLEKMEKLNPSLSNRDGIWDRIGYDLDRMQPKYRPRD
tara:strand:+ start:533 stop:769 length:237 start_codon:yes stop_codon:yes gene_type:complete